MLFSLLIASVSAGPPNTGIGPSSSPMPIIITNRCGVDGTVDHEFMVTMKPPPPNSNGRRLGTQDLLSYLQGWAHQYDPEDTPNGATRRKLQAKFSSDFHVYNFFTATRLGVAVSASNEVSGTPTQHTHPCRAGPPRDACLCLTAPHARIRPSRACATTRPSCRLSVTASSISSPPTLARRGALTASTVSMTTRSTMAT